MTPLILFVLMLLLTFAVLALMLRPTQREADIERHLRHIGGLYTVEPESLTPILKHTVLSDIPRVDRLLRRVPAAARLHRLILQSGAENWTVGRALFGSAVAGWSVAEMLAVLGFPAPMAVLASAAVAALPCAWLAFRRAARFHRIEALLSDAVDLMARALRAGHSINAMIEMAGEEVAAPLGPEFRILFDEQRLGLPLREAMLNLTDRVPLDDVRVLSTAILVQRDTGGNLAEILDKTGQLMRDRTRLRGQIRVYTAQGRMTGWMLGGLPFLMFLLMNFVNPGYERALWTDPLGRDLLYVGLVMMALGALTIRSIIRIDV